MISINEASKLLRVSKRTLRYYEEKGLLKNKRKEDSSYRMYDNEAINRLQQIILLKNLEFSLDEIKNILSINESNISTQIVESKLSLVQKRIHEAKEKERMLNVILEKASNESLSNISIHSLMKEFIYVNELTERVEKINMIKDIQFEVIFGLGIGEKIEKRKDDLIIAIKEVRKDIEGRISQELPLIRLKDVNHLDKFQYQILCNKEVIFDVEFENFNADNYMNLVLPIKQQLEKYIEIQNK